MISNTDGVTYWTLYFELLDPFLSGCFFVLERFAWNGFWIMTPLFPAVVVWVLRDLCKLSRQMGCSRIYNYRNIKEYFAQRKISVMIYHYSVVLICISLRMHTHTQVSYYKHKHSLFIFFFLFAGCSSRRLDIVQCLSCRARDSGGYRDKYCCAAAIICVGGVPEGGEEKVSGRVRFCLPTKGKTCIHS